MKKIVMILICIIFAQCADAKMMTLQQAKEKARAQMDAVQSYVQEKMDGVKIASESAYEKIAADAAAAKQSTEAFIKAHKNELIAAGLLVAGAATLAVGAKHLSDKDAAKMAAQKERYQAMQEKHRDILNKHQRAQL